MDQGRPNAATTEWHTFDDFMPDNDAAILISWEEDGEPQMNIECVCLEGKLFDVNYNEIEFPVTAIWAYWPSILSKEAAWNYKDYLSVAQRQ